MPMFQGLTDRVRGTVALSLQQRTAADIDRLLLQILESAVHMWERNRWLTFDADEVNCTVQLYRWCKAACRNDRRFTLVTVQFEWMNVTAGMLDGTESVKFAKRPDLRFEIGRIGRTTECKRLGPTNGLPRAYVYEGLARFVEDHYGHGEPAGYMVGYVQTGTSVDVLGRVNQQVAGHPKMGNDHRLRRSRDNGPAFWSRSSHDRGSGVPIEIDHLFVKIS